MTTYFYDRNMVNILWLTCSAWEEMAADQKHPISQPVHHHLYSDQLTTLHAPCTLNLPESPNSTMNSLPSFSAPTRVSDRISSRISPMSHNGLSLPMVSAMSLPSLGGHATCLPAQYTCPAHTVAEKTGSCPDCHSSPSTAVCHVSQQIHDLCRTCIHACKQGLLASSRLQVSV